MENCLTTQKFTIETNFDSKVGVTTKFTKCFHMQNVFMQYYE